MTRINLCFFIGMIVLSFISCKNQHPEADTREEEVPDTEYPAEEDPSSEKGDKQLFESLAGEWMAESYLEGIERDKSIYRHRKYSTTFYGFRLTKENLASDQPVIYGFTDHEGFDVPLKYEASKQQFVSVDELYNFEIRRNGEKTELYFPKTATTETYREVKPDFESALRKAVTAGKYRGPGNQTVHLGVDGKVKGFKEYAYYELVFDFTEGIDYDVILFFKNPRGGNRSQGELYNYRVVGNNIHLMQVAADWDNFEHQVSDEVMTFEKVAD